MPTSSAPVLLCGVDGWAGAMKRLILTGSSGPGISADSDLADLVVEFFFRFVWGPLPSPDELATYLGPRTSDDARSGCHWSDFAGRSNQSEQESQESQPGSNSASTTRPSNYGSIRTPNDQLQLIWLLDYFRSHPETDREVEISPC